MTVGGVFDGSRSGALAAEVIGLRFEDLDSQDVGQLKRLILDHLGCCYRGSLLPWGRGMREWALTYAGSGRAGLFASDAEASPAIAAFANATAATIEVRADEMDTARQYLDAIDWKGLASQE